MGTAGSAKPKGTLLPKGITGRFVLELDKEGSGTLTSLKTVHPECNLLERRNKEGRAGPLSRAGSIRTGNKG